MDAVTRAGRMMLWLRLELAHYLDRLESKLRRLAEKLGYPQAWLHEFQTYLAQPRMTPEEFWVRYTLLRMDAESKWFQPKMSEAEARRFYEKHDYFLWRNLVHRRHSAWRRVMWTLPRKGGLFFEYGCGVAPVSAWIKARDAGRWHYGRYDLNGPAKRYADWRLKTILAWASGYHVITALDVFEHLAEPEKAARSLVDQLISGGYLHWNVHYNELANDLDIATKEQLDATARYLESVLDVVWSKDEYRVGRKPQVSVHA